MLQFSFKICEGTDQRCANESVELQTKAPLRKCHDMPVAEQFKPACSATKTMHNSEVSLVAS